MSTCAISSIEVLSLRVCIWSVAQACLTLCVPMDRSLLGSSVHGIFQPRILEQFAISYSRGSSPPRDWTQDSYISCIGRQILYHLATWKAVYILLKTSWQLLSFLSMPHFLVTHSQALMPPQSAPCPDLCPASPLDTPPGEASAPQPPPA